MRNAFLIFAAALIIAGTWIFVPEIFRTDVRALPISPTLVAQAKVVAPRAVLAARLGGVRGDLWSESIYARSYLTEAPAVQPAASDESEARAAARADCDHALGLAPVEPGLWALCALFEDGNMPSLRADRFLEMSYYTGLNAPSIVPIRLRAAGRSNLHSNDVLQSFVAHDILLVLTKLQDMKPGLIAAYKDAIPQNRATLLRLVEQNDPAFAAELRAADAGAH